jgi:hypothetical protein
VQTNLRRVSAVKSTTPIQQVLAADSPLMWLLSRIHFCNQSHPLLICGLLSYVAQRDQAYVDSAFIHFVRNITNESTFPNLAAVKGDRVELAKEVAARRRAQLKEFHLLCGVWMCRKPTASRGSNLGAT